MIEALATAIEFRSEESGGHVRRIHDITIVYCLAHTELGQGLTPEADRARSRWPPSCTTWERSLCPTPFSTSPAN